MSNDLELIIAELERRISVLESVIHSSTTSVPVQAKTKSPKEFLLIAKPKSAVEQTLALAYYYEVISGLGAFDAGDIGEMFHVAKEKSPANLADMISKNVAKGYVMESNKPAKKKRMKLWTLTASGEIAAKEKFVESQQ